MPLMVCFVVGLVVQSVGVSPPLSIRVRGMLLKFEV